MDVLEIMSGIRNITGLHTEHSLPTRVLLRHINTAYFESVIPELSDHILEKVYNESELTDQDGDTVSIPANCDKVIDVERAGTPCIEVPLDRKYMIGEYRRRGTILMYPDDDADHPLYMVENSTIRIWPTLDETDVKISFKKKIPFLYYGKVTVSGSAMTMDNNAYPVDDIYNNYYFHLYTESNLVITLDQIRYVTDYAGSTRIATVDSAPGSTPYIAAMVPIIPEQFHSFIQDATLIQLTRAKLYDGGNISQMKADLQFEIQKAQDRYIKS